MDDREGMAVIANILFLFFVLSVLVMAMESCVESDWRYREAKQTVEQNKE